jgi:SAM-dependent methyltransferase
MPESVDLYDNVYSDFESRAEAEVRRAAFGEDIGQSSWLTAADWLRFADRVQVDEQSHVLEVASGSGGPATYLAKMRGCRVTGVDINEHGVRNGENLAAAQGLSDRVQFRVVDANTPLPFPAGSFDAVLCNDAICHISDRFQLLGDWHRLLRPGGRMLFTDAMVMTGPVSSEELANRSSIGFYLFVPPGENERVIQQAGFTLLAVDDLTDAAATIARQWHDAREEHRQALVGREGETNYAGLQRFLATVHQLSTERRLSRYCYVAEKPGPRRAGVR